MITTNVIKKVTKKVEVTPMRKIKNFDPMTDSQMSWLESTVLLWMSQRSLIKLANWVLQMEMFRRTPAGYLNTETGQLSWDLYAIGMDDSLLASALLESAEDGMVTIYENGTITLNSAV